MRTTDMSKSKVYQLDEYESGSDIENAETLLSKAYTQQSSKKKKGTKKTGKNKSETPRKRAQSAPPAKVGRDLWMNAVKKRQTQNLVRNRPESPRHKTTTEYWVDTLRKTGIGRSTESTGMNTFSGRRPHDQDMAYLSTSSYMRQMAGTEKPSRYSNPATKPPMGTPAYKSPEEYYDQILELKKVIQNVNQEKNELKSKVRRIEEDNIKKEKEISGLLDPKKSDDVRRTLGTKQQDSAAVIHSLKQKILKLEMQNRDRESVYVKLQTDLKTTKIDELKQQLEVCFQEIIRLQNSKETGSHKPKAGTDKRIKALNEAIIRLSNENEQLKNEGQGLKADLNRHIDEKDDSGEYEDMSRKQLLGAIKRLEKQKSKREPSYKADRQGKLALEGTTEERLDQLDKRETELMDKVETQNKQINRLQDEKASLYRKLEDKEALIGDLEDQMAGRSPRRSPTTPGRPPSGRRPSSARSDGSGDRVSVRGERPSSVRGERPVSGRSSNRGDSRPHSSRSGREQREEKAERLRQRHAATKIQRGWRSKHERDQEQNEKVQHFKEERAAKKIQNEWTGYKHRKYQHEYDDAADTIAAALNGHQSRQARLHKFQYYDETETEDESLTEATDLIYSSFKGHSNRKNRIGKMRHVSGDDEDLSHSRRLSRSTPPRQYTPPNRRRPGSAHSRTSNASQRSSHRLTGKSNRMASDYDDDDDIEM